ncbi:VMAP-C domain-containing protein [Catenuloplanes atrovinosus]|uniref:Nucleoside phosphorylase n=1 Tax=Catenuloplanes atrovinosus TaxID=137266 RepID=A0AAE4CA72_9ACTN|nr:hypothetical protein [Catenuloplanes atrovinosus]MDR7274335.1 nucleoside phosphorylase [Catenuloplanes atrovinosus]
MITALVVEGRAVADLLRGGHEFRYENDPQPYRVGMLASAVPDRPHHVALTVLLQDGTRHAASACADLLRTFPNVNCVILVGIGGGIPRRGQPDRHVRLGDIVVATEGVLDYRYVNREGPLERLRRWGGADGLSSPLRRALTELGMRAATAGEGWQRWLDPEVTPAAAGYPRPDPAHDRLTEDGHPVTHPSEEASGHVVGLPKVHVGLVASGDVLLRDEHERDRLAAEFPSLRAFEMEASGVTVATAARDNRWFMVRGITDYCDGQKNDVWHRYASYAAAAYVCALLEVCQPVFVQPWLRLPVRDRVVELLSRIPPGTDLRAIWSAAVPEIDCPATGDEMTALHAFDYLTQWNCAGDGLSPALTFVDALARSAAGAGVAAELRQWVDEQATATQADRALREWRERPPPAPPADPAGPCLVIEIEPDGIDRSLCQVGSYLQRKAGDWEPERGPSLHAPVSVAELDRAVPKLVDDVEQQRPWDAGTEPVIEFLLPAGLMNLPVEWWCAPSQRDIPLCVDYQVAMRSLERMREKPRLRFWRDRWSTLSARGGDGFYPGVHPRNADELHRWGVRLHRRRDVSSVALSGPPEEWPGRGELDYALQAGVPVILWDRRPKPTPESDEALAQLASEAGRDLPGRIEELRTQAAELPEEERTAHEGGYVALLWDDPNRLIPPVVEP